MVNAPDQWKKLKQSREFREFYFFAVALILAFGLLQTTGTALDTEKPVVTVISCSMYPDLGVGDILVVQGTPLEDIEEGDIIVYEAPESGRLVPIVHRVIETHPDYVETQGDNVPVQQDFEKRITEEQIHGVMKFRVPKIGMVKLLAMDIAGIGSDNANPGAGNAPLAIDAIPRCQQNT